MKQISQTVILFSMMSLVMAACGAAPKHGALPAKQITQWYAAVPTKAAHAVGIESVPDPLPNRGQQVAINRFDGTPSWGWVWGDPTELDLGNGVQTYIVIVTLDEYGGGANYLDHDDVPPYAVNSWHCDQQWPCGTTLGSIADEVADNTAAISANASSITSQANAFAATISCLAARYVAHIHSVLLLGDSSIPSNDFSGC